MESISIDFVYHRKSNELAVFTSRNVPHPATESPYPLSHPLKQIGPHPIDGPHNTMYDGQMASPQVGVTVLYGDLYGDTLDSVADYEGTSSHWGGEFVPIGPASVGGEYIRFNDKVTGGFTDVTGSAIAVSFGLPPIEAHSLVSESTMRFRGLPATYHDLIQMVR